MKEYALILVQVTDAIKDGDELIELAPGVNLIVSSAFESTDIEDIEDYVHQLSYLPEQ